MTATAHRPLGQPGPGFTGTGATGRGATGPGATGPAAPAFKAPPVVLVAGSALAGLLMAVKVVIMGELFVGEIVLFVVSALIFVLRGVGPRFRPLFFWLFALAGMSMLVGYVMADLVAVTAPAQYLRGWARTTLFVVDALALMLLVSHGASLLWWFVLGFAAGTLGDMLVIGAVPNALSWKQGYGFAFGMLAALVAGLLRPWPASLVLSGFGVASLLLDYRSLGGVFLVGAAIVVAGSVGRGRHGGGVLGRLMPLAAALVAALVAAVAMAALLDQGDAEYRSRRTESNIGRYVGIVVAVEAIRDSPLVGYGSWAADKRYVQMLRREFEKATSGKDVRGSIGESQLPHSQVLQVWVEGGLLAAVFFLLFGASLVSALRWLLSSHRYQSMTPLYAVLVLDGAWHLLFSPFLGAHRVMAACVLAALSLLAWERTALAATAAGRRAGQRPMPAIPGPPPSPR